MPKTKAAKKDSALAIVRDLKKEKCSNYYGRSMCRSKANDFGADAACASCRARRLLRKKGNP